MRLKLLIGTLILTSAGAYASAQPDLYQDTAALQQSEQQVQEQAAATSQAVQEQREAAEAAAAASAAEASAQQADEGGDAPAPAPAPVISAERFTSPRAGFTCRWQGWMNESTGFYDPGLVYYVADSKCQGAAPVTENQPQTQVETPPVEQPDPNPAPPPGRGGGE